MKRITLIIHHDVVSAVPHDEIYACSAIETIFRADKSGNCVDEKCITRFMEKKGWLQRDDENTYLLLASFDQEDDALSQLQGHSITYRIAMGPQKGRKALTGNARVRYEPRRTH